MKNTVTKIAAHTRKPRLSGAARRKIERQKLAKQQIPTPVEGEMLKRIRVGELETVDQWRKEIGKVYREMRFQTIRTEVGTRLVYVAEIGARLAKMKEELNELEALRAQLAQLQNGGVQLTNGQEYLPAIDSQPDGED